HRGEALEMDLSPLTPFCLHKAGKAKAILPDLHRLALPIRENAGLTLSGYANTGQVTHLINHAAPQAGFEPVTLPHSPSVQVRPMKNRLGRKLVRLNQDSLSSNRFVLDRQPSSIADLLIR